MKPHVREDHEGLLPGTECYSHQANYTSSQDCLDPCHDHIYHRNDPDKASVLLLHDHRVGTRGQVNSTIDKEGPKEGESPDITAVV